ncbi:MAG: hypothetical protein ACK4HW_12355 [Roseinatronobacter sp.]
MLIKIMAAFLVFMVVMGAVQKFLNPTRKTPLDRLRNVVLPRPRKCKSCGKFLFRNEDCRCQS